MTQKCTHTFRGHGIPLKILKLYREAISYRRYKDKTTGAVTYTVEVPVEKTRKRGEQNGK